MNQRTSLNGRGRSPGVGQARRGKRRRSDGDNRQRAAKFAANAGRHGGRLERPLSGQTTDRTIVVVQLRVVPLLVMFRQRGVVEVPVVIMIMVMTVFGVGMLATATGGMLVHVLMPEHPHRVGSQIARQHQERKSPIPRSTKHTDGPKPTRPKSTLTVTGREAGRQFQPGLLGERVSGRPRMRTKLTQQVFRLRPRARPILCEMMSDGCGGDDRRTA